MPDGPRIDGPRIDGLRIDGPRIDNAQHEQALIVRVVGTLQFPAAVQLTRAVADLLDRSVLPVTVLDLSELVDVDHTGIAVLVAAGRDIKAAGSQARIVTSDPRLQARLPYTLGLRRIFDTLDEALSLAC